VAGCDTLVGGRGPESTAATRPPTTESTGSQAAAAPSPSASATPAADSARLDRVVELTNDERRGQGLAPLTIDPRLMAAAQLHSADMARRHYFAHVDPDGKSPGDRVEAQGYRWSVVAENIAAGPRTPEDVIAAWMNSPEHRANILDSRLTQIGVGYATADDEYGTYWTQDFGRLAE
jgi:uncharacterized protein YkwD